jgi:hypothetical protein
MVPEAGLEPARPFGREILSLLCLPISPLGQMSLNFVKERFLFITNKTRILLCLSFSVKYFFKHLYQCCRCILPLCEPLLCASQD